MGNLEPESSQKGCNKTNEEGDPPSRCKSRGFSLPDARAEARTAIIAKSTPRVRDFSVLLFTECCRKNLRGRHHLDSMNEASRSLSTVTRSDSLRNSPPATPVW